MHFTVIAIVPAAGFGRRFGPGTNKPFHLLGGKPLVVWSLETLQSVEEIEEIIPVLKEADREKAIKELLIPPAPPLAKGGKGGLKGFDGVVLGVPVKDTIKEVKRNIVKKTLRRDSLWAIQTPQVFPYSSPTTAFEKAIREGFYSTDDAALIEHYGGKIKVIMGSYRNIKITTPEDLVTAEYFLSRINEK